MLYICKTEADNNVIASTRKVTEFVWRQLCLSEYFPG